MLGASDYLFADQKLAAWIEAHIHIAQFYGGITWLWIPDNAKSVDLSFDERLPMLGRKPTARRQSALTRAGGDSQRPRQADCLS